MNSTGRLWAVVTSRLFLIIALIAISIVGVALLKGWRRSQELAKEVESLHSKISIYEQKNQEMDDLINYFQTDDFAEREARLRLNLKLPGEQVAILPGTGGVDDSSLETSQSLYNNNWQKWWNYFFKI